MDAFGPASKLGGVRRRIAVAIATFAISSPLVMPCSAAAWKPRVLLDVQPIALYWRDDGDRPTARPKTLEDGVRGTFAVVAVNIGLPVARSAVLSVGLGAGFFTVQARLAVIWALSGWHHHGIVLGLEVRPQAALVGGTEAHPCGELGICEEPGVFGSVRFGWRWFSSGRRLGVIVSPMFDGGVVWVGGTEPTVGFGGGIRVGLDW